MKEEMKEKNTRKRETEEHHKRHDAAAAVREMYNY
jgi:hypothetical protein